jgi:hypothetical protein
MNILCERIHATAAEGKQQLYACTGIGYLTREYHEAQGRLAHKKTLTPPRTPLGPP